MQILVDAPYPRLVETTWYDANVPLRTEYEYRLEKHFIPTGIRFDV